MATERLAPSSIFGTLTNLSGTVAAVQDDPNSPDTSWLTAIDTTAGTRATLGFNAASGSLSGLQQMQARVRRVGGANNPTVRLEVSRLGVTLATGPEVTVTSSQGQIVALEWTGADPDQIRVAVVGTASGGSPSKRATVEVGSVEWNATTAEATYNFAGSAAVTGGGAVAASGRPSRFGSASISGGGAPTATGASSRSGSVAISGGGTVAATGRNSTSADAVGSVAISGGGSVAATGRKGSGGQAAVSGAGSVLSVGLRMSLGAAMVSGGGGVESFGRSARFGSVALSGGGSVLAITKGQIIAAKKRGLMSMMGVGA